MIAQSPRIRKFSTAGVLENAQTMPTNAIADDFGPRNLAKTYWHGGIDFNTSQGVGEAQRWWMIESPQVGIIADLHRFTHLKKWTIDSMVIFNSDSSRLFAYVMNKGRKSDYHYDLAGAKINGKWYFFFGSSTVIDRASYQDSIYSPLTFDELSYLARENLSGAFYKDENGEVKVKESFFDFMDDPKGWGLPPGSTRKDIDSLIVAGNKEMYTYKIDPLEIEQIKADMAKSVRPKEPIPDLKWYEKIFPKKKKLFETDEWKEYVKSKSSK